MTSIATIYDASVTSLTSISDSEIPVAAVVPCQYYDDYDDDNDESTTHDEWQEPLQRILDQRRDIINFKQYAVSEEHVQRMSELAEKLPDIFANPTKTQRTQWFRHPNYDKNNQMPNLHVHYRLEMQGVLLYLQKAYKWLQGDAEETNSTLHSILRSAYYQFKGSMKGLHRHVQVEEWKLFPVFQLNYPEIDFRFLYEDHEHLHQTESRLMHALSYLHEASDDILPDDLEDQVVATIQLALDFD